MRNHIKRALKTFCYLSLALMWAAGVRGGAEPVRYDAPDVLGFQDLIALAAGAKPPNAIESRLHSVLNTPFVSNEAYYGGARPHRPEVQGTGPVLRVAVWNVRCGTELDMIRLAFSDPDEFERRLHRRSEGGATDNLRLELLALREADVIVLNEADLGMQRSGYHDVPKELSAALKMNYSYGVEFVEVDPAYLGLESRAEATANGAQGGVPPPDAKRYRGLQGTAVLSRYPIAGARIMRLPDAYDWYGGERKPISWLEKARRWAFRSVFSEPVHREVRRGGRMAMIVDLAVPPSPTGEVSVVATHLEDYCSPHGRQRQMKALLEGIRGLRNPVVLAGDLNTSGGDMAPTSLREALVDRATDYRFWAGHAIQVLSGLPSFALIPAKYARNHRDPTARNIPVLFDNEEAGLFSMLRRFRFGDSGRFDFSGPAQRTSNGREGTLAASDERGYKGFEPSYSSSRALRGAGLYRLDWIMVKPPAGGRGSLLTPRFPRTMRAVTEAPEPRLSDHFPITVDLPLAPRPKQPMQYASGQAKPKS